MHRLSIAAVLISMLALPGCILAFGGGGGGHNRWHDGMMMDDECDDCDMGSSCPQMAHMQAQIDAIERHLRGECKDDCPCCKSAASTDGKDAKASKDDAKPASDAKAPAPAKAKP